MSIVFGTPYAEAYDHLYRDKDYEAECEVLGAVWSRFGEREVARVLDLGCGTGNHALPLVRRGCRVTGVDRSEQMLKVAQRKAAEALGGAQASPRFVRGEIRELDLGERFDAVIMMFAVLGYQLENAEVMAALRTVRRHLEPGALFVFDVWYGPAVIGIRPSTRVREIPLPQGKILRISSGRLDTRQHLCTVSFRLLHFDGVGGCRETLETHQVRFFFAKELELALACADMQLIRLGAFPDFDREPDQETWNVLGVARAGHGGEELSR